MAPFPAQLSAVTQQPFDNFDERIRLISSAYINRKSVSGDAQPGFLERARRTRIGELRLSEFEVSKAPC